MHGLGTTLGGLADVAGKLVVIGLGYVGLPLAREAPAPA